MQMFYAATKEHRWAEQIVQPFCKLTIRFVISQNMSSNKTDLQFQKLEGAFYRSVSEEAEKMVCQFALQSMVFTSEFVIKRFANF